MRLPFTEVQVTLLLMFDVRRHTFDHDFEIDEHRLVNSCTPTNESLRATLGLVAPAFMLVLDSLVRRRLRGDLVFPSKNISGARGPKDAGKAEPVL